MSYRSALVLATIALAAAAPARADTASPLTELVDAAAARLQIAEPVAAFKWHHTVPIEDPARVEQVLGAVNAQAAAAGIDADYVSSVMHDQIDATESLEYARFAKWKLDPTGAPASPADLSAPRAAIDELNNVMVAQMGLRWDLLHSTVCATQLDDALRQVSNARQLDPTYIQALRFATHSYCRP